LSAEVKVNVSGVIFGAFQLAGAMAQLLLPWVAMGTAILWYRHERSKRAVWSLVGAIGSVTGELSHVLLPSGISWIAVGQVERVPTDSNLLTAIIYASFQSVGLAVFALAVLLHWIEHIRRIK
jgi:hypothetical protein